VRGAGKDAAPKTKEGIMAGRSFLYRGVGLLLALAAVLIAACAGGPATTPEPTPSPGAHFVMDTPMAPVSEPPYSPAPEMLKYTVQEGDTLYDIALRYDVSMEELIRINKLSNPNDLALGQELLIPLSPRETVTPVP
jgi:hypothetical protein